MEIINFFRRRPQYVALALLLVGFEFFLIEKILPEAANQLGGGDTFKTIGIALIAMSLGIWLFQYLQGGNNAGINTGNIEFSRIENDLEDLKKSVLTRKDIEGFNVAIRSIKDVVDNEKLGLGLESAQKEKIVNFLIKELSQTTGEQFLQAIEEKYAPAVVRKHEFTRLLDDFSSLINRLTQEVKTLTRRANSNLTLGSIMTFVAMGSLAYIVFNASVNYKEIVDVLAYYIPRLAFIIFIEVFAYFFLKLYKSNLEDIKYYQNELTNAESKIISLKSGILLEDDTTIKSIIESLSKTERNFILKKGESTVDLERTRMDVDQFKEILNLGGILSKVKLGK